MADERIVSELVVQGAQKFVADFLSASNAVTELTNRLSTSERVRTPQLAPQIDQINQALQRTRQSTQQYVSNLQQVSQATTQVAVESDKKTRAIHAQGEAEGHAAKRGVTYLSVLSAIHAASFLLSNQTFTLLGSFTTLGLAFSRLGPVAIGAGLAFGGLLAAINAVAQGAEIIQQVVLGATTALAQVSAITGAALVAAGGLGVKIAADVESQFSLIQAVTGATREALQGLLAEVNEISIRFGQSAASVAEGASLFIRAGGDIAQAIQGGVRAVAQLQVASAGELQAAQAARTVATGLQAFSKEGVTAEQVANAVAAAAQRSALSFTEVNQAFQQAAPGAVTLGISLADLAALIGVLGNAALRGTVAGTSFKQVILDLVNPSKEASEQLALYGINIFDAAGKTRNIVGILTDLNAAIGEEAVSLGKLTEQQRAFAIAQIFGSRAALAGNVLTREGAKAFLELRESMADVTVTNITDVMLLPLNKQLEVLRANAEQAGQAFGGPLLQPFRNATVAVIQFVQGLRPVAQLVGQIIAVLATGQGFGQLQEEINKVATNQALNIFIKELVNSLRNVRDVILNQIVPAVSEFAQGLGLMAQEPGKLTGMVQVFQRINVAIQSVGAVVATAIRNLGLLVAEFINAEGRGGELRQTIVNIASAIVASFIPKLVSLTALVAFSVAVLAKLGESILGAGAAAEEFGLRIQRGLAISRGDVTEAGRLAGEIDKVKSSTEKFQEGIKDLTSGASKTSRDVIKSFQDLAGEIPGILSNLRDDVTETQDRIFATDERPAGPAIVDPNEIKRAGDRVAEAGRDILRRLENLREDAGVRAREITDRATERIEDIFSKANDQLAKLARDTRERVSDLQEALAQRRGDRRITEAFKKQQEELLRVFQQRLEREESLSKRQTEDTERDFDRQQAAAERAFGRSQQAAEQAFRNIQQAREQALSATQTAEEKALKQRLDEEARIRRETQELAAAKTPQERTDVLAKQSQAREDRVFEEKQQSQVDALRARHDATRQQQQRSADAASIAFRNSQEDQALALRLKAENASLLFRRDLEDKELPVKLSRELRLREFREQQEREFIKFQDELEDAALDRQIARIRREALERRKEITEGAIKQAGEILDSVMLELQKNSDQLNKSIRNAMQSFEDAIDNLEPAIRNQVQPAISSLRSQLLSTADAAIQEFKLLEDQIIHTIAAETEIGKARLTTPSVTPQQASTITQVVPGAFGMLPLGPLGPLLEQAITKGLEKGFENVGPGVRIGEFNQTIETDNPQDVVNAIIDSARIGL